MRVLIVDDEPLARDKIRLWLEDHSDIEILEECADGQSALEAIKTKSPDLVFLDIQMPELDGFGVLEAIDPELMPAIVFVTAYDKYAIQAFDVHALDYLLKPYDQERFQKTLRRAREQIKNVQSSQLSESIAQLLETRDNPSNYLERLAVKTGGRIQFVKISEVDWIEAAGNYVKLHSGEEYHLHRETMSRMEERLDPEQFLRIHRSTIVNIDRIKEMQPYFNGEYVVILEDSTKLTLSRRNRAKLQERLEAFL